MIDWTLAGPYVVAILGVSGALITTKVQHKGKPENALIDQLQEEVSAIRTEKAAEIALMKRDIAELKDEQQKSKKRERIRDDYINQLRRHIEEGKPPPAPAWPEGLYD